MRVAPVGMFFASTPYGNIDDVFLLGKNAAAITHGHPTGRFPAGVFALIVYYILQDMPLRNAADESLRYLTALLDCDQPTADAITAALELSQKSPNDPKTLHKLGEGRTAEEALAIALYAALSATENETNAEAAFEAGIILAVNHDGDSDSTGSICGNLLGAALGKSAIPKRWLQPLELRKIIEKIAGDYVDLWEESSR